MDIYVKTFEDSLQLRTFSINPLTIADVQRVAPIAVHLKELNQIAPLNVESLRVDQVRHVDPLRIDRLNITQLPSVNITLSQLPSLDIAVQRVPPIAIALQQQFGMNSNYTIAAKVLGLTVMRMELGGTTTIVPRDCARREQSQSHERSFPDVAAAGNPAIPTHAIETSTQTIRRHKPHRAKPPVVNAGAPRFDYSLRRESAVHSGG